MPTRLFFSVICVASAAAAASACAVRVRPGGAVYVRPAPVYVAPAPPPPRRVYVASAPPPAYPAQPPPAYPAQPPQPAPAGYQQQQPPPAQPPVACIDPGERDISDRFEQAMPIGPGVTVGCIYRGDNDLFLVTAPAGNAGHLFTFALRGAHQMAPGIQVLNFNRKSLHIHHVGTSQEARGWVHIAGGTSIYLRVSQVHGANEPYTLTLAATQVTEPGEPNGDLDHATPLTENGFVQAFMSNPANDPSALEDWYRVDVKADGNLTLDVDMSQDVSPHIKVLSAMRRPVGARSGAPGERIQLPLRVQRGSYYVRIGSVVGVPSAGRGDPPSWLTRPYKLTISR